MTYTPSDSNLFFTKNDPTDIRLGDLFKPSLLSTALTENSFVIIGAPDDEGIKLNGGRVGAASAPKYIRQFLYKMTPPKKTEIPFYDLGDLAVSQFNAQDILTRHQITAASIESLQSRNIKTVSLGGGHDYGYADASGFIKAKLKMNKRPVVLNFDAHLDVRPTTNGLNSGTPFFRLLNEYEGQFDFAEIGIQPQCNSIEHRSWALSKKAQIFNLNEIEINGGLSSLFNHDFFKNIKKDTPVFISFDIDCLSSTEAPGCSQSWVTGLKTADYLNFFLKLSKLSNTCGLGIYEVSPPLDIDNHTSKTAALICYNYLFQGQL